MSQKSFIPYMPQYSTVEIGQRMQLVATTNIATTITYFVGAYYEVVDTGAGTQINKYYYAGSQRIAMRSGGTLFFLFGDHLGSTSLVTFGNGNVVSETKYKAWGEERHASGTNPTKYTYTGQYSYTADFGLMFYNARWVDVSLGRFIQADSLVGGDRYAYVNNSPARFTDPSGHRSCDDIDGNGSCITSPGNFTHANNLSGLTSINTGICQRIGNTYCGGAQVYKVYLWYKVNKGWWNSDGGFTPKEFFAMILLFEANGNQGDLKAIIEAASNQLWGTSKDRDAYCESQSCAAGLFNFIGAYMESGVRRWNALYGSNFNPSPDTYAGLTSEPTGGYSLLKAAGYSMEEIAKKIFSNKSFSDNDGSLPTDWGVVGVDPDLKWFGKAWKSNAPSGTTDNCGVYHIGYDVVYTANQAATWSQPYPNCPNYRP